MGILYPPFSGVQESQSYGDACHHQGIPVVMFNPRLASGDVGIGTNVRELRKNFTSTFNITYSLYPLSAPSGSVFRKYPAPWQVFLEDDASPGRYNLVAERSTRPAGEDLDDIIMGHLDNVGQGTSLLQNPLLKWACCGLFCITSTLLPPLKTPKNGGFTLLRVIFVLHFAITVGCCNLICNEFCTIIVVQQ